jgi:hypothetical protein
MAEVRFEPRTEEGHRLLDAVEGHLGVMPFRVETSGARSYALSDPRVEPEYFDKALDDIDPDWREHLARADY